MVFDRKTEKMLYDMQAPKDMNYTDLREIRTEIHRRLDDKSGKEILLLEQNIERDHGCVRFIGGANIRSYSSLGVLEDKPRFDGNYMILPTKKHAYRSNDGEWRVQKGNIKLYDFYLLGLDKKLSLEHRFRQTGCFGGEMELVNPSGFDHGVRIFSGKDVAQYFKGQSIRDNMSLYDTDFGDKKDIIDVSYFTALKLLNLDVPDDLKQEYGKTVDKDRRKTIFSLETLIEAELQVKGKIKYVYDSIKYGGYKYNGAMTVCENEDDANVITTVDKQKLRVIAREIKSSLKDAIKLDMLKEDLVIDGDKPGIKIHTKDYITNLCEKYKVTIPS